MEEEPDLKAIAIKSVFGTMPLEKRRKLALELLPMARLINGMEIPEIEPKFTRWLCSGKRKIFTTEEAEHAWLIWTFIKGNAFESYCFSYSDTIEENRGKEYHSGYAIEPYIDDSSFETDDISKFEIKVNPLDIKDDSVDLVCKEDYFSWILENTTPEQVRINMDDYDHSCCFVFEDVEDFTIESLQTEFGW